MPGQQPTDFVLTPCSRLPYSVYSADTHRRLVRSRHAAELGLCLRANVRVFYAVIANAPLRTTAHGAHGVAPRTLPANSPPAIPACPARSALAIGIPDTRDANACGSGTVLIRYLTGAAFVRHLPHLPDKPLRPYRLPRGPSEHFRWLMRRPLQHFRREHVAAPRASRTVQP